MTMVAILFGLMTAAFGGRVLFGGDVRQMAQAAVGFVVSFNFVSGFAYVVVSLGLWWAFVAMVRHPLIAIPVASLWVNRPLALVVAGVGNGSTRDCQALELMVRKLTSKLSGQTADVPGLQCPASSGRQSMAALGMSVDMRSL